MQRATSHASFPELVAFETSARDDATVLGVLYAGSQGRGDFDRFSDLDIKVWLAEVRATETGCWRSSGGWARSIMSASTVRTALPAAWVPIGAAPTWTSSARRT